MSVQWGYCDIHHSRIDEVIAMLEKHNTEKYLVGMEICNGDGHAQTNGEHMHFILHINPVDFKNLKEKMRRTFNLAGKNNKQNKPYYGWMLKDIRDFEKLKAYTVKDQNIRSKGYTDKELQELIEISFPKQDERNTYKECMKAIEESKPHLVVQPGMGLQLDMIKLEVFILKYHMDNGIKICKSKIKNLALSFLQLEFKDRYQHLEEIYYYTMK